MIDDFDRISLNHLRDIVVVRNVLTLSLFGGSGDHFNLVSDT